MPRAVWRGTISFGMVSIPVRLYTATENQDISFRQLHVEDNSPIRLVKRCSADGKDLESDEIVRGYEYARGQYVLIDDEDLEKLPVPSKHTIELTSFVPGDDIDPIHYEKSYFVEPEETAWKPYALLTRVLEERQMLAVGKLAMRQRERLCALRPRDGRIQLETLFYHDEVRTPEFAPPDMSVSESELKVANALIDVLAEDFDPARYRDEYRETLLELIKAKLEGEELVTAPEPEVAKPSVNLMDALKASVEAARARKGGDEEAPPRARRSADKSADEGEEEPKKPRSKSRRRKTADTS